MYVPNPEIQSFPRGPIHPSSRFARVSLPSREQNSLPTLSLDSIVRVEARRLTEVDFLNGGIVRFGREHGVPTPLNEAVAALIKGMEASWTQN